MQNIINSSLFLNISKTGSCGLEIYVPEENIRVQYFTR